jgi:HAMP domain-containing protein
MELLFALLAIQTAAVLAAGVWLWRRLERQQAEIAELREALAEKGVKRAKVASARGATAEVIPLA